MWERYHPDKQWIREHLPERVTDEMLDGCEVFTSFYRDDLKIIREYHHGDAMGKVYEAKDEDDFLLWFFKECCDELSSELIKPDRLKERLRWRYVDRSWGYDRRIYVEREEYEFNTIEDRRLPKYEEYLRLVRPVLTPKQWEGEVQERLNLMNQYFKDPHWDYDRDRMVYVEISDSKPCFETVYQEPGDPTPNEILRKWQPAPVDDGKTYTVVPVLSLVELEPFLKEKGLEYKLLFGLDIPDDLPYWGVCHGREVYHPLACVVSEMDTEVLLKAAEDLQWGKTPTL